MDMQISGQNYEVSDAVKERVLERLEPVLQDYPRVESCHVMITQEKIRYKVAIDVHGADKMHIEAEDTQADNLYLAIDSAIARLDKQLRKSREKMLERQKERQRLVDVEGEPPIV